MTKKEDQNQEYEGERLRRQRRKGSYHLVASKNKLPKDLDEDEDDMLFKHLTAIPPGLRRDEKQISIQQAKKRLFKEIAKTGGDTTTVEFLAALEELTKMYDPTKFDARKKPPRRSRSSRTNSTRRSSSSSSSSSSKGLEIEGMWITLSKPNYSDCLGKTEKEEYLYTLGRMSFGE